MTRKDAAGHNHDAEPNAAAAAIQPSSASPIADESNNNSPPSSPECCQPLERVPSSPPASPRLEPSSPHGSSDAQPLSPTGSGSGGHNTSCSDHNGCLSRCVHSAERTVRSHDWYRSKTIATDVKYEGIP
jgi:hypothetical protein